MATIKASDLNTWTVDDFSEPVGKLEITPISIYDKIDGIEDIVDQKFQKAWRLIKKTRWQGHYNTRKRSRRF